MTKEEGIFKVKVGRYTKRKFLVDSTHPKPQEIPYELMAINHAQLKACL